MQNDNPLIDRLLWPLTLLIFAVAGSWVFKCVTPFVALSVVAAATMAPKRGALVVLGAWAANQVMGYGFSGYPVTAYSIGWGAAIAGGAMLSFLVASLIARRGAAISRVALAFVAAFVAYEGSLYVVALAFGGLHTFTGDIVLGILGNDAIWLFALTAAHNLLAGASPRLFGPRLRFA